MHAVQCFVGDYLNGDIDGIHRHSCCVGFGVWVLTLLVLRRLLCQLIEGGIHRSGVHLLPVHDKTHFLMK